MIYCLIVCLAVVVLDQVSKLAVAGSLDIGQSVTLIPGIVDIHRIEPNRGAAFGSFADARWVFMIVSVVAIAAIGVYLIKEKPKSLFIRTTLAAIAGGGIGNMIDRVFRGAVEDFVDVTCTDILCFKYVFNVADIFVTVGCISLICYLLFVEMPRESKAEKAKKISAEGAEVQTDNNGDENEH